MSEIERKASSYFFVTWKLRYIQIGTSIIPIPHSHVLNIALAIFFDCLVAFRNFPRLAQSFKRHIKSKYSDSDNSGSISFVYFPVYANFDS